MKAYLYGFTDEADASLDGQIAAALRNGLDGVELRSVGGQNVLDLPLSDIADIAERLAAAGLSVWSLGSPIGKIGITDDFAPHVERFHRALEVAQLLGTPRMRVFSFYVPEGQTPEAYRNAVFERMHVLCELAAARGVLLCHENEKGIYGDTAARCAELLSELPEMGAVFDPANFIQCGQDVWEAWQLLGDRAVYLHVKDALLSGRVVPAGAGCGCLREVIADFRKNGGSAFSVEPHLTVFSGLAALERDGEKTEVDPYAYPDGHAAFDAACSALKMLL